MQDPKRRAIAARGGDGIARWTGFNATPARSCRYIAGEPVSLDRTCGRPAQPGSSYCGEHHALTHIVRRPAGTVEALDLSINPQKPFALKARGDGQ